MIGNLDVAIKTLLTDALPTLLGGATPAVNLTVASDSFVLDPKSADAFASEPRPDDQRDEFPFDPTGIVFDPADPAYDADALPRFTLSKPPYIGPRRVYLTTAAGDRMPLLAHEVQWEVADTRNFVLTLAQNRALTGVTGVQVLYGVTAVFTLLKLNQLLSILLDSANASQLARGEALVTGIMELQRQRVLDNSLAEFDDGDYHATVKTTSLKLLEGSTPAANQRRLAYQAEIELKLTRALSDDEGAPIVRIHTPRREGTSPPAPARPVDIEIGVES